VRSHALLALFVTIAAVGSALASGAHRRPALVGAVAAALTAAASLGAMAFAARGAAKPVQAALLVTVSMFLVRVVLLGAATAVLSRAGESILPFVIAFFVPYFAFAAIEAAFVHSLRGAQELSR
jgi:hypothetical protein